MPGGRRRDADGRPRRRGGAGLRARAAVAGENGRQRRLAQRVRARGPDGSRSTSASRASTAALVVDWDPDDYATAYDVESVDRRRAVDDGCTRPSAATAAATTSTCPTRSRACSRLALRASSRGQGYGIRALRVQPIAFSAVAEPVLRARRARGARAGSSRSYFTGEQTYWTVVGVDGDDKEALLNEDGMLEVDRGGFSIEPFLWTGDRLVTWNDVERTQSLEERLPADPERVTWKHEALALKVTAFAGGDPGASLLYARYRVENPSGAAAAGAASSSPCGRSRCCRRGSRSTWWAASRRSARSATTPASSA